MSEQEFIRDQCPLGAYLERAAAEYADNEVLIFPDARLTYGQLLERARHHAGRLASLGVEAGDHVGILMPNCPEYIELLFGCALLGGIAVPINARYKSSELAYVVENADIRVLFVSDRASEYTDFVALLHAAFDDLHRSASPLQLGAAPLLQYIVLFGEDPATQPAGMLSRQYFDQLAVSSIPAAPVDVEAPCLMMYTSGTTADPKGCPLSSRALVRSGLQMNRERYFMSPQDRFWGPLPMFHMSSVLPLLACIDAGAAFLSMRFFEPTLALEMMERERATIAFPAFPTITNDLMTHPEFKGTDLSTLRRINNVAPPDVLRTFQEAFPQAIQTGAYGLTEASGVIAFNHPDEPLERRLTTCGVPFTGVETKVVDPETLQTLPDGERGEMCIRGYCLFDGYYKSPDKNAQSMVDGWLRTGDLCAIDHHGSIYFHGRIKDMLKVGGENVAALEIESYLATHAAVKMAQVIGVPDPRLQEVAAAFIELHEGSTLTEAELIEFCQGKIASFKVPRYVRFVTEWPMSSTKIQKFRLRDAFSA